MENDEAKEIPFEEKVEETIEETVEVPLEERNDSELSYKEKQKKYRDMYKNRGRWAWISKLPDREVLGKKEKNPLNKGRTYIKKEHENVSMD